MMVTTLISLLVCLGAVAAPAAVGKAEKKFTDTFIVDKSELASTGRNPYFIIEPGFQAVLEGKEKGKVIVLTITVLNETKLVDGVETRVVEEKETVDGQVAEISRNYFAFSKKTRDVFYFGEDVDIYKNGNVISHEGAWLSGVAGAKFGLMMPGTPLLGARYYQEMAPKMAMDRAEVVGLGGSMKTPAGQFEGCLETDESSALESARGRKVYAPGVGLIFDEGLKLARYGFRP
jgi:hypothetical protein